MATNIGGKKHQESEVFKGSQPLPNMEASTVYTNDQKNITHQIPANCI